MNIHTVSNLYRRGRSATFLSALTIFLASALTLTAQTVRPLDERDQQGLQISLNAGGYRFNLTGAEKRRSFPATARLINRSRGAIPFVFQSPYLADQAFRFRVINAEGNQIWSSEETVRMVAEETTVALPSGKSWSRTVAVPLSANGEPLATGRYTLEAEIAGEPAIGASVVFEVRNELPPPPPQAGEKVLVESVGKVTTTPIPTFAPPPMLRIVAHGRVPSGGWTAPELKMRDPVREGVLELEFIARPPAPNTPVTQEMQAISAETTVTMSEGIRAIRIIARTNSQTIGQR